MMLKKITLCFALALVLCVPSAFAATTHNHTYSSFPETIKVSAWAREEVDRAIDLGFGPSAEEYPYLPDSLSTPAQREWFSIYSSRFIAFQQGCDEPSLTDTVLHYEAEKDGLGQPKSVFTDMPGVDYLSALYYLGVTNGRGDGTFDPNGLLTRQEAATFLARVYRAYGGELPESGENLPFSDAGEIADWARDSVRAMAAMGVMKGYEDGRFAPGDLYSHEQCLLTLLRLYENLPVSRKNRTVEPLYTYEQYMAMLEDKDRLAKEQNGGTYVRQQVDGGIAAFVETETGGSMNSATFPKFVYHSGGMRAIHDLGVCDTGRGWLTTATDMKEPRFSEDGKTFFCTITLSKDVTDYSSVYPNSVWHGHEAGTYQITIDVETLAVKAVKAEP